MSGAAVERPGVVAVRPAVAGVAADLLVVALRERVRRDGGRLPAAGLLSFVESLYAVAEGRGPVQVAGTAPRGFGDESGWGAVVTVSVAAARLECSAVWIRTLARRGEIKARRAGSLWLIDEHDLERYRRRAA